MSMNTKFFFSFIRFSSDDTENKVYEDIFEDKLHINNDIPDDLASNGSLLGGSILIYLFLKNFDLISKILNVTFMWVQNQNTNAA